MTPDGAHREEVRLPSAFIDGLVLCPVCSLAPAQEVRWELAADDILTKFAATSGCCKYKGTYGNISHRNIAAACLQCLGCDLPLCVCVRVCVGVCRCAPRMPISGEALSGRRKTGLKCLRLDTLHSNSAIQGMMHRAGRRSCQQASGECLTLKGVRPSVHAG